MLDIDALVLLLEGYLEEVRVTRSRRTPSRIRLKRKRYYRRRKAKIKRMAKRRRRQPRAKRLAKRRAKIRKRMHIRPGSRRRIRLVNSESREGGLMSYSIHQLIRGFEGAKRLAAGLMELRSLKPQKTNEIEFSEWDVGSLPALAVESVIDDDLSKMIDDAPVRTDVDSLLMIQEDAERMLVSIRSGDCDASEAEQILHLMAEHLDKTVEEVLVERDPGEEFVTIYLKSMSDEDILAVIGRIEDEVGREASVIDGLAINVYTTDPELVARAVEIIGKDFVEEIAGLESGAEVEEPVTEAKKKIKATTISVYGGGEPGFDSVSTYVEVGKGSANLTLRFDRGDAAFLAGYPRDWSLHDEEGFDPDAEVSVGVNDEIEILTQLKKSLQKQFADPDWDKYADEEKRKMALDKIDRAIANLRSEVESVTEARQISSEVVQAFKQGTPKRVSNTHTDGNSLFLHRNEIAKKDGGKLWIQDAGWPTSTTRERLNAVFDEFGIKGGVHQKAGKQRLVIGGKDAEWNGEWIPIADLPEGEVVEPDKMSEESSDEPGGLRCDMKKDCPDPVSYIDQRGFVYCEKHGLMRKQYEPCRKLSPKELKKISSGEQISYTPKVVADQMPEESFSPVAIESRILDIEKRLEESTQQDVAHQIALTWAVSGIADEAGQIEKIAKEFVRSQEDVFDTVPIALDDAGLDIDKYLDMQDAKELIQKINKEWVGKLTVEDLVDEFPAAAELIAMQALGHGMGLRDEQEIVDYLEDHGIHDFDVRSYESGITGAMDAVQDYVGKKGIEIESVIESDDISESDIKLKKLVSDFFQRAGDPVDKKDVLVAKKKDNFVMVQLSDYAQQWVGSHDQDEYPIYNLKNPSAEVEDSIHAPSLKDALKKFDEFADKIKPAISSEKGESKNLDEVDPSLRPPKRWFNKMLKRVKGDDPGAVIGAIWRDLPDSKKQEIRKREGKTYGPAPESVVSEAVSSIVLKPDVKFGADDILNLKKQLGVSVTGLTGEPKILRVGSQDPGVLDRAQDLIGRENIGRVENGMVS